MSKECAGMEHQLKFADANGFALADDGTLDTVLECQTCGEEVRTNPEWDDDVKCTDCGSTECASIRIGQAVYIAVHDHECN